MKNISNYEDYVKYYDLNRVWADYHGVSGFASIAKQLNENFGWRIGTTWTGRYSESDFFRECRESADKFEKPFRMGVDFYFKGEPL
jgi:hypothetical protein